MKSKRRNGFTLVELLTVIAIIALLAGLILGLAGNAQKTAAKKRAESEITQLESSVTDYRTEFGQVPPTRDALVTYLETGNHELAGMTDPWGLDYNYQPSSKATFYLWSTGGDTSEPATNRAVWIGNFPPP